MSSYREFALEREKIDFLLEQGYVMTAVTENLSGAFIEFTYEGNDPKKEKKERLQILHPDSRKYFSTILFQQQKQTK
ncbi:hypothetical protein GCM10010954_12100 [Halobacillus andaensis]|uniref:Uncharacterized protein n=1 Tax=Halobacillus andaensis TaxID=1176239 RepID=A0A917EWF8_HALAA|nr:hypothetical protein [Halobacillus andaensis]MBP2004007.1 hypothetical protein [Halobacillus andaensis]GGF15087.1 hypothetical protein GCM10010954_12100 [Halobacillus andaensis]